MTWSRPLRLAAIAGTVLVTLSGVLTWVKNRSERESISTQTLAPGVTLTKIQRDTINGLLHLYVVRCTPGQGWRVGVVPADKLATRLAPVPSMATRAQSLVAVNGGFFAYEGAAVGAVYLDGEWIRLPWKNRTALGLRADGSLKIDTLQGKASVQSGGTQIAVTTLNGYPSRNSVAVLTPRFGNLYKLRPDEMAFEVAKDTLAIRVASGTARIRSGGFTIIAHGTAQQQFAAITDNQPISFKVAITPADWKECSTILGAGPRLLRAGQLEVTEVQEEFRPDVIRRGPRTALGVDKNGDFLFMVTPDMQSGLTLPELAATMQGLGVTEAINLDGGASTALAIKDQVIVRSAGVDIPVANAVVIVKDK